MAQKTQEHQGELKAIGYELFIAALSILSIANMLLRFFVRDASLEYVIFIINAIMTPIFLGDFLYRFFTAESKSFYFLRGFGWADLFSSLPFPNAKILRLFRLWRVFRLFAQVGARNRIDRKTVDFLLVDPQSLDPIAAIEVDDRSHESERARNRDALVNSVLKDIDLRLHRFPATRT